MARRPPAKPFAKKGFKAPEVEILFTGDEALDKLFTELPESIQKKALRKATREVAKHTLKTAKAYAPNSSGNLEASLVVKAMRRSRKNKHTVGTSVQTKEGMYKGDEFYGGFLEFGTTERVHKSGKKVGRIEAEAHWFLRPALYAFETAKQLIFANTLRAWMDEQKVKVQGTK